MDIGLEELRTGGGRARGEQESIVRPCFIEELHMVSGKERLLSSGKGKVAAASWVEHSREYEVQGPQTY